MPKSGIPQGFSERRAQASAANTAAERATSIAATAARIKLRDRPPQATVGRC
jgi:hypothetical protein